MSIDIKHLVVTEEGPVQGAADGTISVFKGIPYAKPPVGPLRWRAPQSVVNWKSPLQANANGNASLQDWVVCIAVGGGDPRPTNEDCLYLNVWTPTSKLEPGAAPLPVMVWIHGGGYVIGSGGLPIYDGKPLATQDVVVVTINYRLGYLGFFSHPALKQEQEAEGVDIVNNFALLDQIAALQWVQRNIGHFGGDKNNVTIFGQSAGGRSVLSLFASPLANPPAAESENESEEETVVERLFHKGVAQSVYGLPDTTQDQAWDRGIALATAFHLDGENATVEELRALNGNALWNPRQNSVLFASPVPISGDTVLPTPMLDVFKSGTQAKLPLVIGNTSDDSSVLADFGFSPSDVIAALVAAGKYEDVKILYPGVDDDEELGRQVGRDLLFTTMSHLIAQRQRATNVAPGWRYYFDYVAESQRAASPKGAKHGDDVPYVLDTIDIAPPTSGYFTENDKDFAQKVSHYWLEFARSATNSSASIAGIPAWPKHSGLTIPLLQSNQTMGFGKNLGNTIALEKDFMALRVAALTSTLEDLADLIPQAVANTHSYQEK